MLRGRLAVVEETLSAIDNGIDVDIADIRMLCDRNIPKNELNLNRIRTVSDRLCNEIEKRAELVSKRDRLIEDLGLE